MALVFLSILTSVFLSVCLYSRVWGTTRRNRKMSAIDFDLGSERQASTSNSLVKHTSMSNKYSFFSLSCSMTKPTKWPVRPAKTDQPGHPPSLIRVFAIHMKKAWVLSYLLSAQRRLWSDCRCPGWSETSLGAQVILLVLSCSGSFFFLSFLSRKSQNSFTLGQIGLCEHCRPGLDTLQFYLALQSMPVWILCTAIYVLKKMKLNFIQMYMYFSHVTRKPVFGVCDQVRHKPACSATETC